MEILVHTSWSDDTEIVINITDTIGHGKQVPKTGKRDDSNCIWLNREWILNNEDFRAKVIIPYFIGAASEAGMKIFMCVGQKF